MVVVVVVVVVVVIVGLPTLLPSHFMTKKKGSFNLLFEGDVLGVPLFTLTNYFYLCLVGGRRKGCKTNRKPYC